MYLVFVYVLRIYNKRIVDFKSVQGFNFIILLAVGLQFWTAVYIDIYIYIFYKYTTYFPLPSSTSLTSKLIGGRNKLMVQDRRRGQEEDLVGEGEASKDRGAGALEGVTSVEGGPNLLGRGALLLPHVRGDGGRLTTAFVLVGAPWPEHLMEEWYIWLHFI